MKKSPLLLTLLCAAACIFSAAFAGCSHGVDYTAFISEKRNNIYIYEDDSVSVKIYCTQKEYPYAADGYKGEMNDLVEIFVALPKNPEELLVSVDKFEGEMNYQAVEKRYYLSFSASAFTTDEVGVTLTCGGESKTYAALSVKYAGVMSCDEALKCVVEHDKELFDGLTDDGLFDGEIFVRLLYDEGCYYYIGVCDKQRHITAYLIDGERGIVIATKELQY